MRSIIYQDEILTEAVITAIQMHLKSCIDDVNIQRLNAMYDTFIELIEKQSSSDREEPGTECVLINDLDTHIHYTIDEDYDIIISKVVW